MEGRSSKDQCFVGIMGRPKRAAYGGFIYDVLNRGNARLPVFEKDGDYETFERTLGEAIERTGTPLLAYCLITIGNSGS